MHLCTRALLCASARSSHRPPARGPLRAQTPDCSPAAPQQEEQLRRGGREPRWPELRPPTPPAGPAPGVLEPPPPRTRTDPGEAAAPPPPPRRAQGQQPGRPGRSLAPLPSRFCLKQPRRRRPLPGVGNLPGVAHLPELEAEADLAGALTAPGAARRRGPAPAKAGRGVGRAPPGRADCLGGGGAQCTRLPPFPPEHGACSFKSLSEILRFRGCIFQGSGGEPGVHPIPSARCPAGTQSWLRYYNRQPLSWPPTEPCLLPLMLLGFGRTERGRSSHVLNWPAMRAA
ncbi:translation initiation factor IF-2-like [Canis lupus familiaris]|uniref:translation initiation factor IF-2-like n=1 Tax=Canis lupus familiaris TaxID=9615 RepID=UPI0018F322C7|nr:translation initiation factor IF-2-like [Canis lupus familiaris]